MDMIVNHAAKLRFMSGGQTHVPLTIRTMTGAGFGTGGQHADYLEAWFAHTAGIKVVAPSLRRIAAEGPRDLKPVNTVTGFGFSMKCAPSCSATMASSFASRIRARMSARRSAKVMPISH